jgi:hypothetical protein
MGLSQQLPRQQGLPPAMEPIEVPDVMGDKDCLALNRVLELLGIGESSRLLGGVFYRGEVKRVRIMLPKPIPEQY